MVNYYCYYYQIRAIFKCFGFIQQERFNVLFGVINANNSTSYFSNFGNYYDPILSIEKFHSKIDIYKYLQTLDHIVSPDPVTK